jgi:predicted phage tail protein
MLKVLASNLKEREKNKVKNGRQSLYFTSTENKGK